MNQDLADVTLVMKQLYEKDISVYNEDFLEKTLKKRCMAVGFESVGKYISELKRNKDEADELYRSFNVIFSQFFRDSFTFALLEQFFIPDLIRRKQDGSQIRVWSAGCACGQEAYSIAMLIDKLIGTEAESKSLHLMLFATDHSFEALNKAAAGAYGSNDIANTKTKDLNKYFSQKGETFTVVPQLRDLIHFSFYDLSDKFCAHPPESIYGNFDIVLCCNLLFYYNLEIQNYIITKLLKSLSSGGILVTGNAEKASVEKVAKMRAYYTSAPVFQNENSYC